MLSVKAFKPLSTFYYLLCVITVLSVFNSAHAQQNPEIGTNAAAFKLTDLAGKSYQLKDLKGKVVIVNFWASWCGPCRKEMPSMNKAWQALRDNNVVMLAINFGESKQAVADFVKTIPIDFPVLLDETNTASSDWNVTAMPTTVVVDQQGKIVERILGPREWDSPKMIDAILSIARKETSE